MKRVRIALFVGLPSLLAAWLPATSGANRVDRLGFLLAGVLIGFGSATLLAPWPWAARRPAAEPVAAPDDPVDAAAAPEAPVPPSTASLLAGLASTRSIVATVPSSIDDAAEPVASDPAPVVDADKTEPTSEEPSFTPAVIGTIEPDPTPVVEPVAAVEPIEPEWAVEPMAPAEPGWAVDAAVVAIEPVAADAEPVEPASVDAPDVPVEPVEPTEPAEAASSADARATVGAEPAAVEPARTAKARTASPRPRTAKSSAKGSAGANGSRKRATSAKARAVAAPVADAAEQPGLVDAVDSLPAKAPAPAPEVPVLAVLSDAEAPVVAAVSAPVPEAAIVAAVSDAVPAPAVVVEPPAPAVEVASTGATSIEEMVVARLAARSSSLDDLLRLTNGGEGRKATTSSVPPERPRTMPSAPPPAPRQPESIDDGLPASSIVERLARRAVGSSSGAWSLALADLTTAGSVDSSPSPEAARRATEAALREALGASSPAPAEGGDDGADAGTRPVVGRLPDRR